MKVICMNRSRWIGKHKARAPSLPCQTVLAGGNTQRKVAGEGAHRRFEEPRILTRRMLEKPRAAVGLHVRARQAEKPAGQIHIAQPAQTRIKIVSALAMMTRRPDSWAFA